MESRRSYVANKPCHSQGLFLGQHQLVKTGFSRCSSKRISRTRSELDSQKPILRCGLHDLDGFAWLLHELDWNCLSPPRTTRIPPSRRPKHARSPPMLRLLEIIARCQTAGSQTSCTLSARKAFETPRQTSHPDPDEDLELLCDSSFFGQPQALGVCKFFLAGISFSPTQPSGSLRAAGLARQPSAPGRLRSSRGSEGIIKALGSLEQHDAGADMHA